MDVRCSFPKTSRRWEPQSWHIGSDTTSNSPAKADGHSLTICFTACPSRESRKVSAGLSNRRFRGAAVCACGDVVRGVESKQRSRLPAFVFVNCGVPGLDSAYFDQSCRRHREG